MAKLHHMTLKSAVDKYKPYADEGKTEEEVKQTIASDEKGFDADQVAEIYAAIIAPPAETKPLEKAHIVEKEFRDINNFNQIHRKGADVSHFAKDRLTKLVDNGHVVVYDK